MFNKTLTQNAPDKQLFLDRLPYRREQCRYGLIPAARKIDPLIGGRAAGMLLISRAAATPTLRAYQSAHWAAGIIRSGGSALQVPRRGFNSTTFPASATSVSVLAAAALSTSATLRANSSRLNGLPSNWTPSSRRPWCTMEFSV